MVQCFLKQRILRVFLTERNRAVNITVGFDSARNLQIFPTDLNRKILPGTSHIPVFHRSSGGSANAVNRNSVLSYRDEHGIYIFAGVFKTQIFQIHSKADPLAGDIVVVLDKVKILRRKTAVIPDLEISVAVIDRMTVDKVHGLGITGVVVFLAFRGRWGRGRRRRRMT